jgi:hypothetical protein
MGPAQENRLPFDLRMDVSEDFTPLRPKIIHFHRSRNRPWVPPVRIEGALDRFHERRTISTFSCDIARAVSRRL